MKWEILDAASTKRVISQQSKEGNVCQSTECKNAASIILESIDPTVDRCDDFYEFACGNFLKTAVIPKNETFADRYSSLYKKNMEQLKRNIEEPVQSNDPKSITISKNFYNACMDENAIEKNSIETALAKLNKLEGWPLLEGNSWEEKNFDWTQTTYEMQNLGFNTFFFFASDVIGTIYLNESRSVLCIDQPFLSLESQVLVKGLSDPVVAAYYNFKVDVAVIYGANRTEAEEEMKEIVEFEIHLASISVTQEARMNAPTNDKLTPLKDLAKQYPSIPWKEYFNEYLKIVSVVIDDDELIQVNQPQYFQKFEALIKDTPKRVLANYMLWRAIEEMVPYSNEKIRSSQKKYATVRYPSIAQIQVRWRECLEMAASLNAIGASTGALYVRNNLNQASKKSVEELTVDLKEQFSNILKESEWMDEKTRTIALDKLKFLKNFIGAPEELLDEKLREEYYKPLKINPNEFLQAYLNLSKFQHRLIAGLLRKPSNTSDWILFVNYKTVDTTAAYDEDNKIYISAGILQDVFFNENRPQYLNYAGIGSFVIGNTITRAFDKDGGKFDKNGTPKNWWPPETAKKFHKKSACISEQYKSFTLKEGGLKVNDTRTEDKNIADNGGVKLSYLAYQNWVKRHGPEPTLPGLNYSQSQLFWIQTAITQCAKYSPGYLKSADSDSVNQLIKEFDAPSEYRVKGVFSNRPEFAKDFNCPVGSKMNPVKKCSACTQGKSQKNPCIVQWIQNPIPSSPILSFANNSIGPVSV
ncbi:neprilysin-2-like [Belonocnema kinseyi]|uniref:neprilysin-2-like n=1 Tax=Belonocnema kinseyi TaxID=2817044 RepID=UPI00143D853B|nr:neprilysin-2-like [Belonocnema kinseyi]